LSAALGKAGGSCSDRLEAVCPDVFGNVDLLPEERHNFRKNFLVPHFLKVVAIFAEYLAARQPSLKGREKEFGICIRKIFASVVGEAAGAYYLESETRGLLTEDLERMDRLLGMGVCYF